MNIKPMSIAPISVIDKGECKYIREGVIRRVPLFYRVNDRDVEISDSAYHIDHTKATQKYLEEFLTFKYTLGNDTLWSDIRQLLSGQTLKICPDEVEIIDDFVFREGEKNEKTEKDLVDVLYDVFEETFDELPGTADIIIPLSGGFDSRLVAFMVKEFGYENKAMALCYGQKDLEETKISREVAKRLGIEWIFIEYTEDLIDETVESEEFRRYLLYPRNSSTTPHIQDFFAVRELVKRGMVKKGDVFIPGHSGDFLAGSRLVYTKEVRSFRSLISAIIGYHSQTFHVKRFLKDRVRNIVLEIMKKYSNLSYSDLFEIFDWRERQSKYIVNSVRVYEFFDMKWEIPLWHKKLFDFFSTTPNYQRYKEKLYRETLLKLFEKYGVNFQGVDTGTSKMRETLKKIIKPSLISYAKRIEAIIKNKGRRSKLYDGYDFKKLSKKSGFIEITGHISSLTLELLKKEELI